MGKIVDMITDPNLMSVVTDNIPSAVPALKLSIKDFVDLVAKQVGSDKMSALRIWSHGYTHYTSGEDIPDGNVIFGPDNLKLETIDKFAPVLLRLTPLFASPGRAELRGCKPATGKGIEMMKRLAKIWNVPVYGSEKSQFLITWNPPVFMATPDGRFSGVSGIEVSEKR